MWADDLVAHKTPTEIVGTPDLENLVHSPGFAYLKNARDFALAYTISTRHYRILGIKKDGTSDYIMISGAALYQLSQGDIRAALPLKPEQYERILGEYEPPNDNLFERLLSNEQDHENWLASAGHYNDSYNVTLAIWRRIHASQTPKVPVGPIAQLEYHDGSLHATSAREGFPAPKPYKGPVVLSVERDQHDRWIRLSTSSVGSSIGSQTWYIMKRPSDPSLADLAPYVASATLVIHTGDDLEPRELDTILGKALPSNYVRWSQRSSGTSATDALNAALLGSKKLAAPSAKLLNGLPQEIGLLASLRELHRMELGIGQRKQWQRINAETEKVSQSLGLQTAVATKNSILTELTSGTSDVVFLIAHSLNGRMYLPTKDGEYISLEDVTKVARAVAPNRVIVLITCEAGQVNSDVESFAEAFIRVKAARAVFASPRLVDANSIPKLLRRVFGGNEVRSVLSSTGFQQIVEVLSGEWQN